jgi:hypothetical protein
MLTLPGSTIEQEARFTTVRFPRGALQGGRLYYCRHETPQFVWHPPFLSHANGAADGSARISLGTATLELLTPAVLHTTLGALACDPADADGQKRDAYMAMVTIRVRDITSAQDVLQRGGFSFEQRGDRLIVPAAEAMNCTIAFSG